MMRLQEIKGAIALYVIQDLSYQVLFVFLIAGTERSTVLKLVMTDQTTARGVPWDVLELILFSPVLLVLPLLLQFALQNVEMEKWLV